MRRTFETLDTQGQTQWGLLCATLDGVHTRTLVKSPSRSALHYTAATRLKFFSLT